MRIPKTYWLLVASSPAAIPLIVYSEGFRSWVVIGVVLVAGAIAGFVLRGERWRTIGAGLALSAIALTGALICAYGISEGWSTLESWTTIGEFLLVALVVFVVEAAGASGIRLLQRIKASQ
jgi:hypothetical protein